jgi:hypothetical protein
MKGSLDKSWLLLPFFWCFPFSLIPAGMIYFKKVADGQGGRDPYDTWMLVPILCKFLIGTIVAMLTGIGNKMSSSSDDYDDDDDDQEGGGMFSILPLIVQLIANAVPHYIRTKELCGEHKLTLLSKAFVDGTIENAVGLMGPTILQFVPFVGLFFRIIQFIPFFGKMVKKIVWSIAYVGCYVIINMINESDKNKLCNIDFFGTTTDKIAFVVFLMVSFVYSI